MNKGKIRARFKHYRQQIAELNEELESSYYYREEAVSRANQRTEACAREREDERRQAEYDRWDREDRIRKATDNLERARSGGDDWGVAEALRKLKNIY